MKDLSRLFRLSKKTGDRLIIHDTGTDESFVIMDIDEYEFLAVRHTEASDTASSILGSDNSSLFDIEDDDSEDDEIDDWYHAKDVIEDRYGKEYEKAYDKEYDEEYDEEEKKIVGGQEEFFAQKPDTLDFGDEPNITVNDPLGQAVEKKQEPDLSEIPFEPTRQEIANQWKEEPLRDDDEPVFFEEPIN